MTRSILGIISFASAALLALASVGYAQSPASAPADQASAAKPMHGKKVDAAASASKTNKAGKPSVDDAASAPTAKMPAKQGAQGGSAPKP